MSHEKPSRDLTVEEMKDEMNSDVHADCTSTGCDMLWYCINRMGELGRAIWVLHWADKRKNPISLPGGLI